MSDLIERSALLKELESIKNRLQMMDDTQTADKIMTGLFRATVCIKDAPTVDAIPIGEEVWLDRLNIRTKEWRDADGNLMGVSFVITRKAERREGET